MLWHFPTVCLDDQISTMRLYSSSMPEYENTFSKNHSSESGSHFTFEFLSVSQFPWFSLYFE